MIKQGQTYYREEHANSRREVGWARRATNPSPRRATNPSTQEGQRNPQNKKDNEILNPRYRKRYALGRVIAKSPYRIRLPPARPSKVCSNFNCLKHSCIVVVLYHIGYHFEHNLSVSCSVVWSMTLVKSFVIIFLSFELFMLK